MPEKIKVILKTVTFDSPVTIPGSGKAWFSASVSGGARTAHLKPSAATTPDKTSRRVAAGGSYTLNWEADLDVTGAAEVKLKVEGHDDDATSSISLGVVTEKLNRTNKPVVQAAGKISSASVPARFKLVYDVQLEVGGVFQQHAAKTIFVCRQNLGAITATTVAGVKKAVHMEFHPVCPTPTTELPARPSGLTVAEKKATSNAAAVVAHNSPINISPNPAVIPILKAPKAPPAGTTFTNDQLDKADWANKRSIAIIKCTWYCPSTMKFLKDDPRLEWKVAAAGGGPTVKFYDKDGFSGKFGTEVGVYGTGNTEGEVVLEVHLKNTVLTKYRALVRKVNKIPCRFNILKVAGNAGDSPKCTPADLVKHLAITNRYFRQAGVEITLDSSTDVSDGAVVAPGMPGIFTINVPVGKTKAVNDTRGKLVSAYNCRENVLNIVYILSQSDGSLGFGTANPGRDDEWNIADSGNPSTSWKKHCGVQYVANPATPKTCDAVTMKLFAAEPYKGRSAERTASRALARVARDSAKQAWIKYKLKSPASATTTKASQAYQKAKDAHTNLTGSPSDKDRNKAQRNLRLAHGHAKTVRDVTAREAAADNTWLVAKTTAAKSEADIAAAYKALKPGLGSILITGTNGNPTTQAGNYGNTLPHEIGHILCLRHRGKPDHDDLLKHPKDQNLMHATNSANMAQDIDIIQVKGMDDHVMMKS